MRLLSILRVSFKGPKDWKLNNQFALASRCFAFYNNENTPAKAVYFPEIYVHTKFLNPTQSDASLLKSQMDVYTDALLVLIFAWN
jgi:hypothetical protein